MSSRLSLCYKAPAAKCQLQSKVDPFEAVQLREETVSLHWLKDHLAPGASLPQVSYFHPFGHPGDLMKILLFLRVTHVPPLLVRPLCIYISNQLLHFSSSYNSSPSLIASSFAGRPPGPAPHLSASRLEPGQPRQGQAV